MTAILIKAKRYIRTKFRSDLTAGLTVAMVVIPQAMAYAAIVGINPIFGLFTAIIPTIIAAFFGSFQLLISGPTNPTALVTASVLISYVNRTDYLEFVLGLAIIAGIFNIIFGLLKFGKIIRYISNSVLVGFLTAGGVLIISYQIGNLIGITFSKGGGIYEIITRLLSEIPNANPFTLIVSLISFFIMLLTKRINRKLPASLLTIAIAGLIVYFLGWGSEQNIRLVSDYGLPENLGLGFHIPQITLNEFISLGFSGAAIALFGFMETISIAKAMSQMTDEKLDPSREMIAQGLASFVGGFFQCMPSAGSPSRTVINVINGAKTRFSAVLSGASVLMFLLLFSGLIGYIPMATLSVIVIISAAGLINMNMIKLTWQSSIKSRSVMIVTFISTLFLPLEYAIYLGVLTTILIFLEESSHINLSYIVEDEDGDFIELPLQRAESQEPQIAIINIEGDLHFAAVEDLQNQIDQILHSSVRVLIFRFRRTHLLASTGIMALDRLIKTAHNRDMEILFCGLHEEVIEPLKAAGVTEKIGESRIFLANSKLFNSTQNALNKAKSILEDGSADQ
ncbi:MAG: SulP family inorganic anion transporter [Brevefilum sp.]